MRSHFCDTTGIPEGALVKQDQAVKGRLSISPGTQWEYRLARLRFYQGQFVRRSIDVWPGAYDTNKLAEIDCLSFSFNSQLRHHIEAIEAKTTAGGSKEVDRVIWLKGITSLVNANDVVFAKPVIDDRTRRLARRLRVNIIDSSSVIAAEEALSIPKEGWVGFHDPEFGETVVKPIREFLNGSQLLERAGKFLFGTYWFSDQFTRVKQIHTLLGLLQVQLPDVDRKVILFTAGEAATLLALATFGVASWRDQYGPDEFRRFVSSELASGVADAAVLRRLLRLIDDMNQGYFEDVHQRYVSSGVSRIAMPIPSLEDEILRPQEWVDGFLDLTERFYSHARLASAVLRHLDLRNARRLGSKRDTRLVEQSWRPDRSNVTFLADLIENFITQVWKISPEVFGGAAVEASAAGTELPVMDGATREIETNRPKVDGDQPTVVSLMSEQVHAGGSVPLGPSESVSDEDTPSIRNRI
jgi:hypothetical protein